jgi:hypothetical protein
VKLSKNATKAERLQAHKTKMHNKRVRRQAEHERYLKSDRAKRVARWALYIRTSWHKSIWPAAKVERRAAAAHG